MLSKLVLKILYVITNDKRLFSIHVFTNDDPSNNGEAFEHNLKAQLLTSLVTISSISWSLWMLTCMTTASRTQVGYGDQGTCSIFPLYCPQCDCVPPPGVVRRDRDIVVDALCADGAEVRPIDRASPNGYRMMGPVLFLNLSSTFSCKAFF